MELSVDVHDDLWDLTRHAIDSAHSASSYAIAAAKHSTSLAFSLSRSISSTVLALADAALFPKGPLATPALAQPLTSALDTAEVLALAPLRLAEYVSASTRIAAHAAVNLLAVLRPGAGDASFSLASFVPLVRREWALQAAGAPHPERKYGIAQVARAVVAWVALQGVTQEWQEQRWLKHLRELDVADPSSDAAHPRITKKKSRIRVTSDVIFPGERGPQVITADIGEPVQHPHTLQTHRSRSLVISSPLLTPHIPSAYSIHNLANDEPLPLSHVELKSRLRRLSKMVLAGYGGASMLFFGVTSPPPFAPWRESEGSGHSQRVDKAQEEAQLTRAVDASEEEAAGRRDVDTNMKGDVRYAAYTAGYSWWDVFFGRHDSEIFQKCADHGDNSSSHTPSNTQSHTHTHAYTRQSHMNQHPGTSEHKPKRTAIVSSSNSHRLPRFWVLTDHVRSQVIVVLRGTMSLNEIAVDLTCDPVRFVPSWGKSGCNETDTQGDGEPDTDGEYPYLVHGGMLRLARAMGAIGKPVQVAVRDALKANEGFELILCGHSLGAGVAAMIGMMWADPNTCRTVPSSGLPVGRRTYVYCLGPPTLTSAPLARLTQKLITSLVYSHDVVARLSLGTTRDLKNSALWLCDAQARGDAEKSKRKAQTSEKEKSWTDWAQDWNWNWAKDDAGENGEGWAAVMHRAKRWREAHNRKADGEDCGEDAEDARWFIAMRKTLEANMTNVHMYPPGRVLWAMRESDLHPKHRRSGREGTKDSKGEGDKNGTVPDNLRLFEVLDVEQVFSQLVFARNMLTAHLPHQYDRVLHDLL